MTSVDFSYAFAPPHRLTVALPDNSNKTLLDVNPDYLRLSWSYDNLINKPLAANVTPRTEWEVVLKPQVDGHAFPDSHWTRVEGWLPVLENIYSEGQTSLHLEVAGTNTEAIIRVEVTNLIRYLTASSCTAKNLGVGMVIIQPGFNRNVTPISSLPVGWIRPIGSDFYFRRDEKPVLNPNSVCLAWNLKAERNGWAG